MLLSSLAQLQNLDSCPSVSACKWHPFQKTSSVVFLVLACLLSSLSMLSLQVTWPKNLICLDVITFKRLPCVSASLVNLSVHEIRIMRLRNHNNRGKCYMDEKRIQRSSNASQHVPIYLQSFLIYSKLLVENCNIFIPHLCLAAPQGVIPSEFREDLDIHKTRMNGLSCGEESMTICSALLIQYQRVTDGRTDRRTSSL